MDTEEPPRPSSVRQQVTLPEGQRLCVTGLSLTDPAAAAADGQPMVRVWAEVRHEELTIGMLWPEQPAVAVPEPVEIADSHFLFCHDSASSGVRLYGYYVDPEDPEERRRFVDDIGSTGEMGGEHEEEDARVEFEPLTEEDLAERYDSDNGEDDGHEEEDARVEFEPLTEEDLAERYDSDNGEHDGDDEEEEDGEYHYQPRKSRDDAAVGSIPLVAAPAAIVVPDGELLWPARFAAVKNTAGFMQIAAAEDGTSAASHVCIEIVVLYRYTRFSRTWSGRRGVEACRRTKLHWLRFAVPPAGDLASSLAWAGSSLSPLIYPALFRRELRDLWSSLAAPAIVGNAIPPQATRLQVVVDVGILRREDHTAERMEHMRDAVETIMGEPWPEYYHVGMELHLPQSVRREDDDGGEGDGSRPVKRRKVAAEEGEECSLCFDPLESGLAAWPGCGHEFHGECVEKTLARSDACPLCRRKLSDDTLFKEVIQSC